MRTVSPITADGTRTHYLKLAESGQGLADVRKGLRANGTFVTVIPLVVVHAKPRTLSCLLCYFVE